MELSRQIEREKVTYRNIEPHDKRFQTIQDKSPFLTQNRRVSINIFDKQLPRSKVGYFDNLKSKSPDKFYDFSIDTVK